jgi:glycosidase
MSDWTCAIMNEYPNMNIVGEEWFGDPGILSYWQKGKQNVDGYTSCLPSLMDFPLQEKLVEALNEEEGWEKGLTKLYLQLGSDYHYPAPEDLVIFPDNHDMPRIFKKLNNDYDLFKMAMAYILTTRGIPQIYYGTEILMAHPESDSHGDIREDFPGGWTGDAVDVFEKKGLTTKQKDAMAYVRRLLHWRQNAKSVHDGSLMHYIPEDGIYVFFRNLGPEHVMVIMNKNETAKKVTLDRFQENIGNAAEGKNVMEDTTIELEDYVEVPAKTVLIIEFSESE